MRDGDAETVRWLNPRTRDMRTDPRIRDGDKEDERPIGRKEIWTSSIATKPRKYIKYVIKRCQ